MIHIDLFSGIGGFSLAARWMGWKTLVTCEIEEFPRKVLQYHFPETYHHEDIKTLNYETINLELSKRYGSRWRNDDVIVTGGFPCQPYSIAGKRKGTNDDRYLWPEMLRAIREISPRWVVAENVSGLLTQQSGLVFERVCADLETAGYKVQPIIISACAVNAPHRRDRVWIIAHCTDARIKSMQRERKDGIYKSKATPDSNSIGLQGWEQTGKKRKMEILQFGRFHNSHNQFNEFPTKSPICSRDDGLSMRLDGITFSKWRNESIKAYGNAVVPQIVFKIFKAIEKVDKLIF